MKQAIEFTDSPWLTDRQACHYIGVSRTTLFRLRKCGVIRYFQFGRLIRYKKVDLDLFMNDNKVND